MTDEIKTDEIKLTAPRLTPESLRERAESLLRKTRADISGMSQEDIQTLVQELQIHQIELKMQNEELRMTQFQLAKSLDRFSDLYDFAPVSYLTLDHQGTIEQANLTAASMLGVSRDILLNRKLSDFVTQGSQDELYLHLQSALVGEKSESCEVTMNSVNDSERIIRMESHRASDADASQKNQIRTAMIDVTEQRKAEEIVIQAKRLRMMVENLPAGAVFVEDGRIELNCAAEEITGYPRYELPTIDQWFDKLYQEKQDEIRAFYETRRRDGFPSPDVIAITRKDGVERMIEFVCHGFDHHAIWLMRDVTDQRQNQQALRVSEERLSMAFRATRDAIWDCDLIAGTVWWSNEYDDLFGERPANSDASWQWWIDHIHPDDRERVSKSMRNAANSRPEYGDVWREEYRYRTVDGRYLFIKDNACIARNSVGEATRILGAMQDITDEKRTQNKLALEQAKLKSIINGIPDALMFADVDRVITFCNPAVKRLFGYEADELIGQPTSVLYRDPEDHRRQGKIRFRPDANVHFDTFQAVWKRKDNSSFDGETVGTVIHDSEGNPLGFLGLIRDVTERKSLERHVLKIAGEESRRIGNDLHDGLGQELTGLAMMAESLFLDLKEQSLPESAMAEKIAQQIDVSLQHIRKMARGMNPVEIEPQGLGVALSQLAAEVSEMHGISCTLICRGQIEVQGTETATHLFRIAQEAITNAVKHGEASTVVVELLKDNATLILRVTDNGSGMDDLDKIQTGTGMRSMRYRADIIGGSFNVESSAEQGATVTCELSHHCA